MKSWKANFVALLAAETLAMIGFGLSGPVVPLFLEEDIGITDPVQLKAWVGFIQSSAAITLALFAPIWGHLADTFSRRAMLLRAMFGGAVVISLSAFVTSPMQFLILKSIQGCLTGTVAAATVLTAGITPAAQVAFALGLLQTCIAVGNSLGPLVGGVLADLVGYRAAFFSTGVTLALAGVIVLKWVDPDKRTQPKTAPGEEGQLSGTGNALPDAAKKKKKISLFPDVRPILASPLLITMMVITFLVQSSGGVSVPMLPLFMKELASDSAFIASSTGVVLGIGAASTAIAAVIVGKFSSRFGYWPTLIVCLALGAALTVPQALVMNVFQLAVLRALSCFFIGGTMPLINAIIAVSSNKNNQGSIYGINASVSSAGHAIGPLIGTAVAMLNFRVTFIATAIILGLSTLEAVRRRKKVGT